tara:strand:+ start:402 stop:638 length:237 start_codon:yes stop_codon:yes gene_type:complete
MSEELVKVSTEEIAESLVAVNKCLIAIGERLEAVEKYVQTLSPADKIFYKPKGTDEYLNIKDNFDNIYERLGALEDGV